MIYDCFTFFNELDLLEIRLNVLKDVVDKFVLVEATQTFTGRPKPLYYKENAARFSAFADKIIHVVVDDFSAAQSGRTPREKAWMSESIQRNAIARGLQVARPDDTVLISDLDEIPKPETVKKVVGLSGVTGFGMMPHVYFLNHRDYVVDDNPNAEWTHATQALSYADFVNPRTYAKFKFNEFVPQEVNGCPSATVVRFLKPRRTFYRSGWHFTYLGGVEAIVKKLKSFAHTEFSTDEFASPEAVKARLSNSSSLSGGGGFFERLDETYPEYLVRNQEKYAALVYPVDDAYLEKVRPVKVYCDRLHDVKLFVKCRVPKPLRKLLIRLWLKLNKAPTRKGDGR